MVYLLKIKEVMLEEFFKMWWFVLLSIIVAAIIKTYRLDIKLRDYLCGKKGYIAILLATVAGVFSPLCSCGILPIAISLSAAGVPIPIVMALLITSPIMGPDAFIITRGGLGAEFAVLKLVTAVMMGLFSGFFTQFLLDKGVLKEDSFKLIVKKNEDGSLPTAYEISCENDLKIPTMTVIQRKSRFVFFLERAKDVGLFMVKMLVLAIFFEALLLTFVPIELVKLLVGSDRFTSVLLSAVVGLPLPVNQISVVPVLAALIEMGISKAAALTLLIAGPVSSFPAMITLFAMFDKRVFLNYLFISFFGSVVIGYGYLLFFL